MGKEGVIFIKLKSIFLLAKRSSLLSKKGILEQFKLLLSQGGHPLLVKRVSLDAPNISSTNPQVSFMPSHQPLLGEDLDNNILIPPFNAGMKEEKPWEKDFSRVQEGL